MLMKLTMTHWVAGILVNPSDVHVCHVDVYADQVTSNAEITYADIQY